MVSLCRQRVRLEVGIPCQDSARGMQAWEESWAWWRWSPIGGVSPETNMAGPSGSSSAGVHHSRLFPRLNSQAEPLRDFDASRGDRFVQSKDKATGEPLWVIEVIDADPQARAKTVRVKVAAAVQPVLPPAPAGMPFTPVEFTGLAVTPYVNQAGRLAYSLKAAAVRAPSRSGRGSAEMKDAAA